MKRYERNFMHYRIMLILITASLLFLWPASVATAQDSFGLAEGTPLYVVDPQVNALVHIDNVRAEDIGQMSYYPSQIDGYGIVSIWGRAVPGQEPPRFYYQLAQVVQPVVVPGDTSQQNTALRLPANQRDGEIDEILHFLDQIPISGWSWYVVLALLLFCGVYAAKFLSKEQKPINIKFQVAGASDAENIQWKIGVSALLTNTPQLSAFLRRLAFKDVPAIVDALEETIMIMLLPIVAQFPSGQVKTKLGKSPAFRYFSRLISEVVYDITGYYCHWKGVGVTSFDEAGQITELPRYIRGISEAAAKILESNPGMTSVEAYRIVIRATFVDRLSGQKEVLPILNIPQDMISGSGGSDNE